MTACDSKDIPYIHSRLSANWEGFNLYPHPNDIAKAVHSVIFAFEWPSFMFLYERGESENSLKRVWCLFIVLCTTAENLGVLKQIIDLFGNNVPVISIICFDPAMSGDYKPTFRRIRKSSEKRMVVIASSEAMPEFLRQVSVALLIGIEAEFFSFETRFRLSRLAS